MKPRAHLIGLRMPQILPTFRISRAKAAFLTLILLITSLTLSSDPAAAWTVGTALTFYAGDGGIDDTPAAGPALSSPFTDPVSLATDSTGNVYVADSNGAAVLKVDTSGQLTFLAGTGSAGTPVAGLATSSPLNYPDAVAVDPSD